MSQSRRYFTSPALDRAAEIRGHPERLSACVQHASSLALVLCDGKVGIRQDTPDRALGWLPMDAFEGLSDPVFLGLVDDTARFSFSVDADVGERLAQRHGLAFRGLRSVATLLDTDSAGLGAYAQAMDLWQRNHRFCGLCGGSNRPDQAGFRMVCSVCEREQFPRLDPAIIVSVRCGDRLLLGRQPNWPAYRFSVLAGFVEPGETLESAVRREVREESGVRVGDVHYQGSQPWPFPSSLMVGFRAEATESEIVRGDELDEVRWFSPADAAAEMDAGTLLLPQALSISRFLVDQWLLEVSADHPPLAAAMARVEEAGQ